MKLEDLVEKKLPGTYAGVRFDDDTLQAFEDYVSDNEIPKPNHNWHATLLYSNKNLPNYTPIKYDKPFNGKATGFDLFDTDKSVLVLKFSCPNLEKRHKELMDEHNATWDYDEYIPHVTLSYDGKDIDISKLPKFEKPIRVIGEYHEELS